MAARIGGGECGAARWALIALVVFVFVLTNRHQWADDVRDSADDATYLAYAMSFGIDLDTDFSNEFLQGRYMAANGRSPRSFYGAGLLAAPFVGMFSLIDRALGNPVINDRTQYLHSWSYFGFSFAVHFYFLTSFLLLWKVATAIVANPSRATIFLFTVGSGVVYFVLMRPRMTHAFEFFALSLVAYATVAYWRERTWRRGAIGWLALAAFAVNLSVAVRMNDANVAALPILLLLVLALTGPDRGTGELPPPSALVTYAALSVLMFLPFAVMNVLLFDVPFPLPSDIYRTQAGLAGGGGKGRLGDMLALFFDRLPEFGGIVAGGQFGLLYTDPVAVIGIALGLPALIGAARHRPWLAAAAIVGIACYVLFSATFAILLGPGMSWGQRYLFPLFPLGFVAYLSVWARAEDEAGPPRPPFRLVHAACIALSVFSTTGQALYTKTPSLTYQTFEDPTDPIGFRVLAPGIIWRLAREIVAGPAWSVAFRDGVYGFVNKTYVNRTYLRWRWNQMRGIEPSPGPNRQHPPVVTLFMAILALGWFLFFRRFRALAAALPPHDQSAER